MWLRRCCCGVVIVSIRLFRGCFVGGVVFRCRCFDVDCVCSSCTFVCVVDVLVLYRFVILSSLLV